MRPVGLEVADIFRQIGPAYREQHAPALSRGQRRVMRAIERCRTAALGGHVEQCDACGHQRMAFNSCRNRHCPKCQSLVRAQWLEDRQAELLPVEYFHVVFTVPQEIAAIAYQNKAVIYDILFQAASQTLRTIAADRKHLGAEIGFIAILHTWGQNLLHHPHLHCVVPGGGIGNDGQRWIACRPGFFLPVRVLSRLFRRLFLLSCNWPSIVVSCNFFNSLRGAAERADFEKYLARATHAEWVVYAKAPFGGPEQVLQYLGRYTHRVAISNNRLLDLARWAGQLRLEGLPPRSRARRPWFWTRRSSFAASCCMFCHRDSSESVTTDSWPIAIVSQAEPVSRVAGGTSAGGGSPEIDAEDYHDRYQRLTGVSLRDCPHCGNGQMVRIEPSCQGPCHGDRRPSTHEPRPGHI